MAQLSDKEFNTLLEGVETAPGLPVFQDRPEMPPADRAGTITSVRFPVVEGMAAFDVPAPISEKVNQLYDAMPAGIRDKTFAGSAAVKTGVGVPLTEIEGMGPVPATAAGRPAPAIQALPWKDVPPPPIEGATPPLNVPEERRRARSPDPTQFGRTTLTLSGEGLDWAKKNAGKFGLTVDDAGRVSIAAAEQPAEGRTARQAQAAKAAMSDAEFQELLNGVPAKSATMALTEQQPTKASDALPLFGDLRSGIASADSTGAGTEETAALFNGVRKGIMDVPLGAAQAVLPRETMLSIESAVRDFNSRFAELEEKNPEFDYLGRMAGGVVGIMVAARLLGPTIAPLLPAVASRALTAIGPMGRGALAGGAVGGTLYYPEGPEGEERVLGIPARAFDTAMGTMFGTAGGIIARGVQTAAKWVSSGAEAARERVAGSRLYEAASGLRERGEELARQFYAVLGETAAGITRNSERPLQEALARYRQVETAAASRYGLRNAAGRSFEGFPSGVGAEEAGGPAGFKQALQETLEASRDKGIETRRVVEGVASRVRSILGIDREEGRLAAWRAEVAQYNTQLARAREARAPFEGPPLRENLTEAERAAEMARRAGVMQAREVGGQVPPLPQAPAPFVVQPIRAEDYAQARTAINAAMRRTRDTAARTQMKMMLGALDDVAAAEAVTYGMSGEEFIRRAALANRYYERNVAPLRGFFGGRTAREVEGRPGVPLDGMTPAAFYDKIATAIGKNDLKLVRDLAGAFGPSGRDNMKMIAASEAIEAGSRSAKGTIRYVKEHEDTLRELLGREEFAQLKGLANIAQHVQETKPPKAPKEVKGGVSKTEKSIWYWGHSVGPVFGLYQLGHAIADPAERKQHLMEAAVMFSAVPMAHLARRITRQIHEVPWTRALVRSAADVKPGSPAMGELLQAIERRVRSAMIAVERAPQP